MPHFEVSEIYMYIPPIPHVNEVNEHGCFGGLWEHIFKQHTFWPILKNIILVLPICAGYLTLNTGVMPGHGAGPRAQSEYHVSPGDQRQDKK